MLSIARSQRSCPQCRQQILTLFKNSFVAPRSEYRIRSGQPTSSLRTFGSDKRSRPFSTTTRRHQDVESQPTTPPRSDDIEVVVRQAKHAFGDTLPSGYLNDEEYRLYVRLYGAPVRETRPEDVGMPIPSSNPDGALHGPSQKILLREGEDGELEEVVYQTDEEPATTPNPAEEMAETSPEEAAAKLADLPSEAGMVYINAVAKSQREYDALLKLQKDFETSSLRPTEEEDIDEEEPAEEEEDDLDEDEPDARFERSERLHEHTRLGQWRTSPTSIHLPKTNFVDPIAKLLDRTDTKHVREAAEKAFGGPGLPHSVATPSVTSNVGQKPIGMEAGHHRMSEIEADAYVATNLSGMYASAMSVLVEIRKRLGTEWITNLMNRGNGEGPRVLDVGAGGASLAAWQQILNAEWEIAREGEVDGGIKRRSGIEAPGKKTVVVGSDHLRNRISRFLHNTTFLPRLPDYLHSGDHPEKLDGGDAPQPRKQFDIIVASHLMMPLKDEFKRKSMLDNLWEMLCPEGGILIVLEKGHPRGFEAVADARSRLINEFIITPTSDPRPEPLESEHRREREPGMIVAPCTNHKECPMYLTPGLSTGRKDFCHFSQRFIRPPFLQKILGATHRNHEDVDFSFVAVQRGVPTGMEKRENPEQGKEATEDAFIGYENSLEAPNPLSLPRNILPPLKRRGHVTLDLCTPAGTIERWTVPKSFSRQAYRDARKARWGDLWALGAKTRVARPVRLGRGGVVAPKNDGGVRAREAMQGKGGKPRVINLNADAGGIYSASEKIPIHGPRSGTQRRTKGGKKLKIPDLMEELTAFDGEDSRRKRR